MIYQGDAEILFPPRVIAELSHLRGEAWQKLVEEVNATPQDSIEKQAFTLMMIRLDGCLTCTSDSYRALRGCSYCARQTITRYRGKDEDLLEKYATARADVERWHATGKMPDREYIAPDEQ